MAKIKTHAPGTFSWIELLTTDLQKAKKFYGETLGWSFQDTPIPGGGNYTMALRDGSVLAGLYEMDKDMKAEGIPPHWNNYIAVEDADKTAAKAKTLGAKVIEPAFDVMDVGRMAVIEDPTGAVFSLWQPKRHKGAEVDGTLPGNWCWNELGTTDLGKAKSFYKNLFGWDIKASGKDELQYTEFSHGGRPIGGMYQITKEMTENGVPPHWMVYFTVDDVAKRTAQIKKLGGDVMKENETAGDVGTFTIGSDPTGAWAGYIQLTKKW